MKAVEKQLNLCIHEVAANNTTQWTAWLWDQENEKLPGVALAWVGHIFQKVVLCEKC